MCSLPAYAVHQLSLAKVQALATVEAVRLLYPLTVDIGAIFTAAVGEKVGSSVIIPANLGLETMHVWIVNPDLGDLASADRENASALGARNLRQHPAIGCQEIGAGFKVGCGVGQDRLWKIVGTSQFIGVREIKASRGIKFQAAFQCVEACLNAGPLVIVSVGVMRL